MLSESHGEEDDAEDDDEDDEDDEGDEAEEAEEENDRRYNLRQRKTLQRYEAPPIGNFLISQTLSLRYVCKSLALTTLFFPPEPVNRKQSNPSLFDTHRSPARRSHIR